MCPGAPAQFTNTLSSGLIPRVSPDAVALGHAKVVLDNGLMSGGITVDGNFTMYVSSGVVRSLTNQRSLLALMYQ